MSVSLQRGKRLSGTGRMQPLATAMLVLALGYWLRFYGPLPSMLQDAAGGAAYVIFWILILAAGKPNIPARRATALVLVGTCALEVLQLWHPAWLEAIRRTLPGRLLLGTTFEWLDFPPYFVGALAGWLLLRFFDRLRLDDAC
jgi:hypothetical protein